MATAFGGVLGLTPLVAIAFPILGAVVIGTTRYVSLMSILVTPIAVAVLIVLAATSVESWAFAVFGLIAVGLIEYMHLPNIRRLLNGTEPKIGKGGDRPATG